MANTKKNTTSGSRKNYGKAPRSSTNKRPAQPKKPEVKPSAGFMDYFHAFSKTRFFTPIMSILVITVIVLLDMLFAWNNFGTFFMILGIELFIVAAIWLFGLLFNMSADTAKE